MDFFIIATGYNCSAFVQKCYDSLVNLEGEYNWSAVLIDDGSEDDNKTQKELQALPEHAKIKKVFGKSNEGAAFRRWEAIKKADITEETVIILLGMDDELLPNALHHINRKYLVGAWMTYGNWITPDGEGLPEHFSLYFDNETHIERNYRKVKYRSTAPNTFKRFLFDQFVEDDFKYKGEWVKSTTESNLMLSILEMCGKDRIGVIETPIYIYNKWRKDNARNRFGINYQNAIYSHVINKPKRNQLIR